ncbi:hypothetical protein BD413DRAFT_557299 [Trametes elegans]|nr:hypothetical protein BD413DRAFT_557299 [Trametes elegans]
MPLATCSTNTRGTRRGSGFMGVSTIRLCCPQAKRQDLHVGIGSMHPLTSLRRSVANYVEAIRLQDPQISTAVIFGLSRFQNGVIIHPHWPRGSAVHSMTWGPDVGLFSVEVCRSFRRA